MPPQITPENILQPHISYPYNPLIANVLYSTTYIENWGSGVKRIMEACQKRGVAAPTWIVNGGFVVVTFLRPTKDVSQDVTQDVTQGVTQGVTQEDTLDEKIEKAIKDNFNVTTEDLAKHFGVTSMTIKRHLAKMPHIRYVGSGYSGHWEVLDQE
ncbi:ATP-binding protein [Segatella albensis]|uniref:ATP-binding protein n=1 Tax=Segatella albensis TaxID=77768 RepID=UPI0009DC39AF|nr:ATP-binding protein [Segatella albensis]